MPLPFILINGQTTFCTKTGFGVGTVNVRPSVLHVHLSTKCGQLVRFLSNQRFLQKTFLVDWFVDLYVIYILVSISHSNLSWRAVSLWYKNPRTLKQPCRFFLLAHPLLRETIDPRHTPTAFLLGIHSLFQNANGHIL